MAYLKNEDSGLTGILQESFGEDKDPLRELLRNTMQQVLAVTEMYVQSVSTRKVLKITEELCGLDISKSQVLALAKGLDTELTKWRRRPLLGKKDDMIFGRGSGICNLKGLSWLGDKGYSL